MPDTPPPAPAPAPAPDRDVIIVGAGPVGLSLALGLARHGVRVTVLERERSTAETSRAPAIWPRTQEILAGLGVLDAFRKEAIEHEVLTLLDADADPPRPLLELPFRELADETSHPRLLILPQSRTEALLCRALREQPTAEVRFCTEAVALEQDARSVRVTCRATDAAATPGTRLTLSARFVVGCDGARSTIRERLGIELEGITYDARAALADVLLDPHPKRPLPRLSTAAGLAIGIRIDLATWRLILPIGDGGGGDGGGDGSDGAANDDAKDSSALDRRIQGAVLALFSSGGDEDDPDTTLAHQVTWRSTFRLHRRLATSFAVGRVALAGDAAHLNSPVGGQGMNAGIQDGASLRQALLLALRADDRTFLWENASQRRAAIETGVNRFTDRMTRVLLAGRGRLIRPALRAASLATRIPPLRRRLLRRLAMLDG